MKPILLLETRINPMVILTSRSLTIDSISSQGAPVGYQYSYIDLPEQLCYGQAYELLDTPCKDLTILAHLGEESITYEFSLRS